ncbi:MAG: bifunctional metallophosphatase/5'-nucleotidase [Candidatus Latescibacteria bacterium]|nr:bifunctional metallophosphatase/5'-nucleotidase [Candidatus Latescibacterota bacterium]
MRKITFIFCVLAFSALLVKPGNAREKEVTVLYTANSNGKLRACGCPNDPYGGLAERVTLIRELRKKEKPFLLVDSGNMVSLFGGYEFKASIVMRIMNLMKYDVSAAGRNEMFKSISGSHAVSNAAEFPLISASIADKADQNLVFNPYTIKKINGTTVAVTAVCDSTCYIRMNQEYDYMVLPADELLKEILSDISMKSDFIIVLSQMAPDSNKKLLEDFPEIDLIVEGYGNKKYDPPVKTSNGIIVSPGTYGQFIGLVTLNKSDGNLTVKRSEMIPVLDVQEDKKAAKIVLEYFNRRP